MAFFRAPRILILAVSLNLVAGWWVGIPVGISHLSRGGIQQSSVSGHRERAVKGPLALRCQQYSLYEEQEKLIVERGRIEGEFMPGSLPLAANIPKIKPGSGSKAGFGGGGKKSKKAIAEDLKALAKSHAAVLKKDGVVRIDNVISADTADSLRSWALDLRVRATEEV
jgi:hypothetical protein